ncbi:MAG: hypothetical protein ACKVVP_13870 [Chloroflexota bacterium]
MPEDESTQRLATRLADLRQLGDRNRPFHPVSVLRNDIAKRQMPQANSSANDKEPSLEERAEVLARRILSPVLARAEQFADFIRVQRARSRDHRDAETTSTESRSTAHTTPRQEADRSTPHSS